MLNIKFALVIREIIEKNVGEKATIKWPNDIYVGSKKIAGILIQNNVKGEFINSSVLGVGINVNSQEFPATLPNPISIRQLIFKDIPLITVVHDVTNGFLNRMRTNKSAADLNKEFVNYLYLRNEKRKFKIGEDVIEGIITGIGSDGKLIVIIDGHERFFAFREIEYLIS